MKSSFLKPVLIFCALAAYAFPLSAAPVYRWEDEQGIVHYSSKPGKQGSKPADLPPIMRGEVKMAKTAMVTCKDHGGTNCQSGADKDGSVICYDGFTGAAARYRFSCNSPKLEITDITDPDPRGAFTVFVRNSTSVAAAQPALLYKPGDGKETKLEGPAEIEPFGIAEFVFSGAAAPLSQPVARASIAELNIICANCP